MDLSAPTEYARVTEIIREVFGLEEGLVDWIRRTERAGVDTKKILQTSGKRGTRIHDYVSKAIQGKKTRIQKKYKDRTTILLEYLKDKNPQTEVALKLDSPIKHQGHVDYIYQDGTIADLKTGRPRLSHEMQVQGYGYLYEHNVQRPKGLELLYLGTSSIDIVGVEYNPDLWVSLLKLYEWKKR